MGFFNLRRSPAPAEIAEIPLFPLHTVLFPGGMLNLKIFEQRYLDMIAACLKANAPFGVCLIARGSETGSAAEPHGIGTLAEIVKCDMEQLGILLLTVRGGRRFHVLEHRVGTGQSVTAQVRLFAENAPCELPAAHGQLVPFLQRIINDAGEEKLPQPHRLDDADWVGNRICEVLPIQNLAKQKLMELENPLDRLEILEKYLKQHRLLS